MRLRQARPPHHRKQLKQITDVESALHDFERRIRELRRVVQDLSKDVENYQGLCTPHLRDRWGFPWVDAALIHLIRCPKAENLPRCLIEKSHRLLDLLCFHCPEIGAPGNSRFPAGRAEN